MLTLDRHLRIALAAACLISAFDSHGQVQPPSQTAQAAGSAPATGQKRKSSLPTATPAARTKKSTPAGTAAPAAVDKPKPAATAKKPTPKKADTQVNAKSESVTKWVPVSGDFRTINGDPIVSECPAVPPPDVPPPAVRAPACRMDACAALLAQDETTPVGKVSCLSLSDDLVSLTYTADSQGAAAPAFLLIGKKSPPDHLYNIPPVKLPAKEDLVTFEQPIAGDFCQKDGNCNCTTALLKPDPPLDNQCASFPRGRAVRNWQRSGVPITAYVRDASSSRREATLTGLTGDIAEITFAAPSDFKPAFLDLIESGTPYPFAYTPAQPPQVNRLNYAADDLSWVCDLNAQNNPDCANTKPEHLQLKPLSVEADVGFVAMTDKLLVALVKAPMGLEPTALIVTNANACSATPPATCSFPPRSTIVRRTIKPGQNDNLLRVDMTIMDQGTVTRNYGHRIAKRYLAVTLDVKNPTAQKLQFSKSAVYFDVDYAESKEQDTGFKYDVKTVSSLGLWPSIYRPPFIKTNPPRVARFGLEQNVRHSPLNYLSVLGAYDYTTETIDKELKGAELFGALLSTIATGGIIAERNTAFRDAASVLTSAFLPGLRSIVLDTPEINRKRANLVGQTLQDVIQVPAGGSTSTVVLLPRMGILAFTDAEIPVVIDRVIDVHLDEEVVGPVKETPVRKGQCTAGNTKDQTRQALGEPTGATTAADNTSTFTYSKGPVASVAFDATGKLQSCKTRSASEQLDQATTLAEASQTLTDLGLTSTKLALADGSTILVDIPGVQTVYRFDSKGARLSDYTLLFDAITAEKGAKKADFDTFLENKAQPLSANRSADIKTAAGAAKGKSLATTFTYDSPDLQDGKILVKFKKGATETTVDDKNSTVNSVSFAGAKPKSVN